MPLILQPQLTGIAGVGNKRKHSVSFAYNWVGDVQRAITLNGFTFTGSSYTLDVAGLPSSVADLPAFRTLQLSQEFDASSNDEYDGELFVSVSGTGQLFRFGQSAASSIAAGVCKSILTAIVPIVANAPSKLTFAKGRDFGGAMFGVLTASIFDFDLAPVVTYGYANDGN